ncbi:hypothetical protein GCM10009780_40530 [Actinomadura alba]
MDYVHDGHMHRIHDDHVDECEAEGHTEHRSHTHLHGDGCGHVSVPHGDHMDYIHDGCRHAEHQGHWDEH